MTEEYLITLNAKIGNYISFKDDFLYSKLTDSEKLIREFIEIKLKLMLEIIDFGSKSFQFHFEQSEILKKENKKTSFLFNPLRFFYIGETQHSFLLAKLLDPNSEHGQHDFFLKSFLTQIGIENNDGDEWIVTAETGRIDILIKRKHPHSVIVIENKSNHAIDQECQLYRYWLQEMFLHHDEKEYRYTLDKKNNYRLIYLTPDEIKVPTRNSLLKPDWPWLDKYPSLPKSLEKTDVQILQFNIHIVTWLNNCVPHLDNNHRLQEYVKQYIELWTY